MDTNILGQGAVGRGQLRAKCDEEPRNDVAFTLLVENLLRCEIYSGPFANEPLDQLSGVEQLEKGVLLVQL